MDNPSNCWVCGRTAEEVRATQVDESQADAESSNQLAQLAQYRSKLMKSAENWRRAIPNDIRQKDFEFIVDNPNQYSAFSAIGDVAGAKKEVMGWLATAIQALRTQNESELQTLKLSPLRSEDRAKLQKSLEEFESRWHRRFAGEAQDAKGGYAVGFKGLTLSDGIEYLIAGGSFYYDVLGMMVQFAREEKARRVPKFGVGAIPLKGLGRVPICDVCREMIIELREAAATPVEVPAAAQSRAEEEPSPRPMPAVAPHAAPRRMRAQEADEGVEGSPGYVEIVKKLGNSPIKEEEEAVGQKPRYLHEHRLKEDWQALEQQQGN